MKNGKCTCLLNLLLIAVFSLLVGCDGDDDDDGSGDNGSDSDSDTDTDTDSDSDLDSDSDTDTDSDSDLDSDADSGGGAFTVKGDYNGNPLDYVCNLDDTDEPYQSGLQCQELQFFVNCRPYPWDQVPDVEVMQLWFYLPTNSSAGTYDYTAPFEGGISWGEGMATPLGPADANRVTNQIIIEEITPQVSAKGSYSAEWTDEGGNYGTVSGSFDFVCE